jgi:glutamate N-acetyltransferase/amino-acid N-acetyltransferase
MAVGDFALPTMHPVPGVTLGTAFADVKGKGSTEDNKHDLLLVTFPGSATVAGVFTQNAFCAAPVTLCKQRLAENTQAWLVNSGNANACTGEQGLNDARATCAKVAECLGTSAESVMPFSTGVIGEPLPVERISAAIPAAFANLNEHNWPAAASAIMTTDTRPKGASRLVEYQGQTFTITGISKGAGMIKPNMATMLAYIATDLAIAQPILQDMLAQAADRSFNRITIDGDTSTNDSCMLVATGVNSLPPIKEASGELYELVASQVNEVLIELAKAIVADGEGATKLVSVLVEEGTNSAECLQVAYSICHSPLVKTALFASDPNWGRIVAAIGYAGVEELDADLVRVYLDDVLIVENGGRAATYTEQAGQAVMDKDQLQIRVLLGRGEAKECLWTTDLSHGYVTINAEYRT